MSQSFPTSAAGMESGALNRSQPCPACGVLIDMGDPEPLSKVVCPSCGQMFFAMTELDHFRLEEVLGQGGMGTVFKAYDITLDRHVALKLLRSDYSADAEYIQRLQQEAGVMAMLNHPNVVRVYSTGEERGRFYLAMEIIPHGTLDDLLQTQGRLAESQALNIGVQVASGLKAAYDSGVLHRDVKPGNILFLDAHNSKITDFGLAESVDASVSETGDIIGTPYYIAPERLNREVEDHRSDIYSLGATLFHALAGRPPFEAADATAVALKHLKSQPVSLQTFAPHVSGATAYIINRTLLKDPDKRYQSYDELIEHLEYARAELDSRAASPKEAGRPKQRVVLEDESQQKAWAWVSIGMVGAVVLGLIAFLLLRPATSKPAGGPKHVRAAQTAGTAPAAGVAWSEDFRKAVDLLAEGEYAKAADGFRKAQGKSNPQTAAAAWALLNEGLAEWLAGRPEPAARAFAQLETQAASTHAADPKVPEFFKRVGELSGGPESAAAEAGGKFNRKNFEVMGLLAAGVNLWRQEDVEAAAPLLQQFRSAQPAVEDCPWIADLRALATSLLGEYAGLKSIMDRVRTSESMKDKLDAIHEAGQVRGACAKRARKLISDFEPERMAYFQKFDALPKFGYYQIINRKSQKALEVENAGRASKTRIIQAAPLASKRHQQWLLNPIEPGVYRIDPLHVLGMTVDLDQSSMDDGRQISLEKWHTSAAEQWRIEKLDDGSFRIVSVQSGKVCTIRDGATADAADLCQTGDKGAPEQRWELRPVPIKLADPLPDGDYIIANARSSRVLDVDGNKHDEGAAIWAWEFVGQDNQRWHFNRRSDGCYRIEALHSHKVLDVENFSKEEGAIVHQWSWTGGQNQRWKVEAIGDGRYQLRPSYATDRVLGIAEGSMERGAAAVLMEPRGIPEQAWLLVPVIKDK